MSARTASSATSATSTGPLPGPVPVMSACRVSALTVTMIEGRDPALTPGSPCTNDIKASASRACNGGPPWAPRVSARSGCWARHALSAIRSRHARSSAPSTGVNIPRTPTQPSSAAKNRTVRAACCRSRKPAPSRSKTNRVTVASNVSGDCTAANDKSSAASSAFSMRASTARCSDETSPSASAWAAPATFSVTSAAFACSRARRVDDPVARAIAAAVSRPRVPSPVINAAEAASTVRRIRSSSLSPLSISARVQPAGAITGTTTLDQTAAPLMVNNTTLRTGRCQTHVVNRQTYILQSHRHARCQQHRQGV